MRSILYLTVIASLLAEGQSFTGNSRLNVFVSPVSAQRPSLVKVGLFGQSAGFQVETPACSVRSVNNRHSSSDWLYNIRSIPQSTILRDIRNPVMAVASWSAVVSVIHRILLSAPTSSTWHQLSSYVSIPGTAHSFLVSALGLLLVFRTNSAYQRFLVRL